MSLTLEKNSPHIIFGVLTCQNKELAYARSGDNEKNKGYETGTAAFQQIKKGNILKLFETNFLITFGSLNPFEIRTLRT